MLKNKKTIFISVLILLISFSTISNAWWIFGDDKKETDKSVVKLDMWTFVSAHADYYQRKAKEFNKAHPEFDFKLNTQSYPYDQMHDKLNIALQTGTGAPDLVDIEIGKFPGIVANSKDSLVNLTSVIDKYRDEIVQTRVTPYSDSSGNVYGIPTHIGTGVMYYNKELFEKAGVLPSDIKTWQDFVEVGKKITKDTDGDGKIDQWMTGVPISDFMTFNVMSTQLGSNIFDKKGDIILNRSENVRVLQYMQNLVHKYKIAKTIPFYDDKNVYKAINDGKYAAVIMPQWYMIRFTEFMTDLKGKVVVRPLPKWGSKGTRASTGGGTGTAITETANNKEIAKDFLSYAKLTKEAGVEIWTELGFDPMRKDAYNSPKLYKPLPYFNNEKVMEIIKELQPKIQPFYLSGQYATARDIMNQQVLFKVIKKNKDPEKALNEATKRLKEDK
ncbi:ABC transporter substrate-binding protein [Halanaerocella petrolearia]